MGVLTFTIEADAISGTAWRDEIVELMDLFRSRPDLVHIARTTGARREASAGSDPGAAQRRALMEALPEIPETGLHGVSRYGEAVYGGAEDQGRLDRIHAALWPNKTHPDRSEANDALHLATHLKHMRDYFVTTDRRIRDAAVGLGELGIRVVDPSHAAALARAHVLRNSSRLG